MVKPRSSVCSALAIARANTYPGSLSCAIAAGMVVNAMCQCASIKPGINVWPVPSIVSPNTFAETARVTDLISPSDIATSIGPVIRPSTLSKTLTFDISNGGLLIHYTLEVTGLPAWPSA